MTLLAEVLQTAKDAREVHATAIQQLNEAHAAVLAANVCLSALCKPVCLIAVQKYNARAREYSIDITTMETAVEFTEDSLRLLVALRDHQGRQPDEEFGRFRRGGNQYGVEAAD